MRTFDAQFIKSVITDPEVWPWVSDGGSPANYEPNMGEIYLRVGAGVMLFRPWAGAWWDVHIAMPRKCAAAVGFVGAAFQWMREQMGARGFVARMSSVNRAVLRLARAVGFKECGRVRGCMRGHDMVLMEMN